MCNINGLKDHSTRHQMDVSDQCKTYRKSQELPLGTFAFRILLKRRGLSLSEFGVRMSQLSLGRLMSVHRTIQTYGPASHSRRARIFAGSGLGREPKKPLRYGFQLVAYRLAALCTLRIIDYYGAWCLVNGGLKPQAVLSAQEVLAGLVE